MKVNMGVGVKVRKRVSVGEGPRQNVKKEEVKGESEGGVEGQDNGEGEVIVSGNHWCEV